MGPLLSVRHSACARRPPPNPSPRSMMSLDEFASVVRHVRPDDADVQIVRMYREAVVRTQVRARRPRSGAAPRDAALWGQNKAGFSRRGQLGETEIDMESFLWVARRFGITTVRLEGDSAMGATRDAAGQLAFLVQTYRVYEPVITVRAVQAQEAAKTGKSVEGERTFLDRLAAFNKLFAACNMHRLKPDVDALQAAWLAFRLLLSEWGRIQWSGVEAAAL